MFKTPYYKQTDPDKQAGQLTGDQTLGDYIARKQRQDAFDVVNKEMNFDQWWKKNPLGLDDHQYEVAKLVWCEAVKYTR